MNNSSPSTAPSSSWNLPPNHIEPSASTAEAVKRGYFSQVRYLLEFGHRPNERLGERHRDGRTPLILCCLISDPIWSSSLARNLLEKGAKVGLRESKYHLNALHFACIYQRPHLVKLFLRAIDYSLEAADRFGNTALHYAAVAGGVDILQQLIRAFQQYDFNMQVPNSLGMSPLMCAWMFDNLEAADLLQAACASSKMACLQDSEGKSLQQYEEEAKERITRGRSLANEKARSKHLRYFEASAWREHQASVRRQLEAHIYQEQHKSWKQLRHQHYRREALQALGDEKSRQGTLLAPASDLDVRNVPERVFACSPADIFSIGLDYGSRNGSAKSGMQSAKLVARRAHSAAGPRMSLRRSTTTVSEHPEASSALFRKPSRGRMKHGENDSKTDWRNNMVHLFHCYEHQFSSAYCQPAKQPPAVDVNGLNSADCTLQISKHPRRNSILSNKGSRRVGGGSNASGSAEKVSLERVGKNLKSRAASGSIGSVEDVSNTIAVISKAVNSKRRSGQAAESQHKLGRAVSRADFLPM